MSESELYALSSELEALCLPMLYPDTDVEQSAWAAGVRRGRLLSSRLYGAGVCAAACVELRRLLPLLMFQSVSPVFGGVRLSHLLRQSFRCHLRLPDGLNESRLRLYLYGLTYNGSLLPRVGRWLAVSSASPALRSDASWQRLYRDYRSLHSCGLPSATASSVGW